jgi:hypothetical protein
MKAEGRRQKSEESTMAVMDDDIELLEGYLDDALAEEERALVRARLSEDQALVAALDQLRAERGMRQALFAGLEPGEGEVERLVGRIHESLERRRRVGRLFRGVGYVAAAAACFIAGILIHANFVAPGPVQPVAGNGATVRAVELYEVTLRDESGKVLAVQRFDTLEKAKAFANDLANWQRRADRLATAQFVVRSQRL